VYNPIVYEVSLLSSQNYFVLHLYVKPVAVDTVKIFVIILLFVDADAFVFAWNVLQGTYALSVINTFNTLTNNNLQY
jgi:hypothetical protein